jgi:hypothetical protein
MAVVQMLELVHSIDRQHQDKIKELAKQNPDEEIGGVVTGLDELIQIPNMCADRASGYIPENHQYINISIKDGIKYIWHTHVNDTSNFSPIDINQIWADEVPWLLYCLQQNIFRYKDPRIIDPYLGREWVQSLSDCYSLIRDFYMAELEIYLPVPYHSGSDRPWLDRQWNGMIEKLPEHFDVVGRIDAKAYDLVVFNGVRGLNPSHMGLLLDTRSGYQLLHHQYGQGSELTTQLEPEKIHSIWRSKCKISQSNYLAIWGLSMGEPTSYKPIELMRV